MAQYIDKAALVAEIEKRIGNCAKQREDMLNVQCHALADDASARIGELNCIKDFLDTLEVKEVDLEKEFYDFLDTLIGKDNGKLSEDELFRIAEYFFELGLKASNPIM